MIETAACAEFMRKISEAALPRIVTVAYASIMDGTKLRLRQCLAVTAADAEVSVKPSSWTLTPE